MTYEMFVMVVLSILGFVAGWYLSYARRNIRRIQPKLITETMMKINFNPTNVRWEWSQLNPKTRTWEWLNVEATIEEIGKYKDVLLSEKEGLNILYGRIGENNNG